MPALILAICLLIPYFNNAYDLSQCDFEENYRCEVIHGIGVAIPPAAWVTMWFDNDGDTDADH